MSSGLIILIGFIISAVLMLIVWFLSKNTQRKSLLRAEIERQKAEIIVLIHEAIGERQKGAKPQQQAAVNGGMPVWGKWLMTLSLVPLVGSFVLAGTYRQNVKSVPPTTTTTIITTSDSTTTAIKTLVSIQISPLNIVSLAIGSSQQYTAIGLYSDGSNEDITTSVIWTSSNISIASVYSNGFAYGVAVGTINIWASYQGVTSPSVNLIVSSSSSASTLSSIEISPEFPYNVAIGVTEQFTAYGHYSDGSTNIINSNIVWTSSNPLIATISSGGLVTGKAAGTINITASYQGVASPSVNLIVSSSSSASTLSSIEISPEFPYNVAIGVTEQFTAYGHYSDGSTNIINSNIAWTSSNPMVATISSGGLATGKSSGTVNITASYQGVTSQSVSLIVSPATQ